MRALIAIGIGALCTIFILVLVIDCALGNYREWREKRDMTIRNQRLSRFGMSPFKGTKDRFLE